MSYYHSFILLIFIVKMLFTLSVLSIIYAKKTGNIEIEYAKKWKRYFEYIFITLMSILILYLFQKPKIIIAKEEKLLFTLFAIVLLLNTFHEFM